jgi:hypothetical protein
VISMRAYFNELEVEFLLKVLREFHSMKRRQITNLIEEQEHLTRKVAALRMRFLYQGEHSCAHDIAVAKERLQSADFLWLPTYDKQATILHGLIIRLENLLKHKRGRPPYCTIDGNYALIELYHKTARNTATH